MTIELIIAILSLTISIGGLVAAGIRREAIFAVIAVALVTTSAVALWRELQHRIIIKDLQDDIAGVMGDQIITLEMIREKYYDRSPKLVQEALITGKEGGLFADRRLMCKPSPDMPIMTMRVYFLPRKP